MSRVKEIELQQLAPMRDVSQKISQLLQQTLTGYLTPLAPLLAPSKILGEHLEGFTRARIPGADKNFARLEAAYVKLCRDVFRLPSKIRSPVPAIKTKVEIYPWQYIHQVDGDAAKTVTISSPVSWVVAYDFPYKLANLLKAQLDGDKPSPEDTKQLIINSLTMEMALQAAAGIKQLLEDLRFPISTATSEVSGDMPYVVINAAIEAFRPQDELIWTVVQLSGQPVFEELVDEEAIDQITDPLVSRIKDLS
jgi:hypothetical protein